MSMTVESTSGSSQPDSSALGWIESTIAAAESYAREVNAQTWDTRVDGVDDHKSSSERALDAFWANDPNRPLSTYPGYGGSSGTAGGDSGNGGGSSGTNAGGGTEGTSGASSSGTTNGSSSSPVGPGSNSNGASTTPTTSSGANTTTPTTASGGRPTWILNPDQSIAQTSTDQVNVVVPPSPSLLTLIPGYADWYNATLQIPTSPTSTAPPPPQPNQNPPGGVQEVQDAGAPDGPKAPARIISGSGPEVDELINKSPSLRQMWQEAKDRGWRIEYRERGRSEADPNEKIVWINKNDIKDVKNFEKHMASLLAHEIGHAGTPSKPREGAATEEDYVRKNLPAAMAHEGAAAFHNARARDEILAAGGPDIGIRGGFDQEYIRIYEQFKSGAISEAEAMSRMTYFMSLEPMAEEGGRYLTKQEVEERKLRKEWDDQHPTN